MEHPTHNLNNRKKSDHARIVSPQVSDREHASTAMKDKGWVLEAEDLRPDHQKLNSTPANNIYNSEQVHNSPRGDNESNLNTSRLGQVDKDCAIDFVKDAFNEASEKDVLGQKSDR